MMDSKQLKYFVTVYEHHSFTRAAEALYITQQGLSKSILHLENELKVPLFRRVHKGVVPTVYGEAIYQSAKNILAETRVLFRTLDTVSRQNTLSIQVAVAMGVRGVLDANLFENFLQEHPEIHLEIHEYTDIQCDRAVFQGEADLGLSVAPFGQYVFSSVPFARHPLCLLMRRDDPLAGADALGLEQLKDRQFILLTDEFKGTRLFKKSCHKSGFEPNILFSTVESLLIGRLVTQGKGIGLVVSALTDDTDQVKKIALQDKLFWEIHLIKKRGHSDPYVETLFHYLTQHASLKL